MFVPDAARITGPSGAGVRESPAMEVVTAAGAGFLLAVLWFDLMFDVQVRHDPVDPAAVRSIAGYYRRVTTDARPMNRLVALAMLVTLVVPRRSRWSRWPPATRRGGHSSRCRSRSVRSSSPAGAPCRARSGSAGRPAPVRPSSRSPAASSPTTCSASPGSPAWSSVQVVLAATR